MAMKDRPLLARVGQDIGPYRTLALLGRGYEGDTFLAARGGRQYAVKVLRGRNMKAEVKRASRYYDSLKATRGAVRRWIETGLLRSQPGVGDRHYVVFEFTPGKTIRQLSDSSDLENPIQAIRSVCRSLSQIHKTQRIVEDFDGGRNIVLSPDQSKAVFIDLEWASRYSRAAVHADLQEVARLARYVTNAAGCSLDRSLIRELKSAESARAQLAVLRGIS